MSGFGPGTGVVCDLDGVLYRGEQPVPGSVEAVQRLRASGAALLFCTNNSYPTIATYKRKLAGMGIVVGPHELLTSAIVTADALRARDMDGARALVLGGEGLRESLRARGIEPNAARSDADIDLVVVGYDPSFDYNSMRRACNALLAGAPFFATNDDVTFPAPGGVLWPGTGAILASLVAASGRAPEVMGKPHAPMMDAAADRLRGAREVLIVGDRPDTDLAGGRAKGWTTVLVLSGVTDRADVAGVEPRPDLVVDDLSGLVAELERRG
jgi:4-nitrophenyl phosphatase